MPLKVKPDAKSNCVRMINEKGIKIIIKKSGVIVQKAETRAENFPPIEVLDVIDKIAARVKSA